MPVARTPAADTVRVSLVRDAYASNGPAGYGPDRGLLHPDVVFHIAGRHPLSGDHVGGAAVAHYLGAVDAHAGRRGGFTVTSVFTDESEDLVLVEGTAAHSHADGDLFVRPLVHLLRFEGAAVVELWDNPFDQRAEDRFWCEVLGGPAPSSLGPVVPAQRRRSSAPPLVSPG